MTVCLFACLFGNACVCLFAGVFVCIASCACGCSFVCDRLVDWLSMSLPVCLVV